MNNKKLKTILLHIYAVDVAQSKKKNILFTANKINNSFKKCSLNPIYRSKRNVGSLLVNNKEIPKKLDKSGIYQINRAQCNPIINVAAQYIIVF